MKTCPECDGDGVIEKGTDEEQQCPTCGGSGVVPDDEDDNKSDEVIRTAPESCAPSVFWSGGRERPCAAPRLRVYPRAALPGTPFSPIAESAPMLLPA